MYGGVKKKKKNGQSKKQSESKEANEKQKDPTIPGKTRKEYDHHQEMDPTCEDRQPKEPGARLTGRSRNRNREKRNRGAWR